ncbi:MAG: molybdopterin-binding/glycosyltransferase family 2 protein [Alphaproteobacteria bacterium]
MFFGNLLLDEAEGAVLAHSLRTRRGVLKKGRVLSAGDIAALREAGFAAVLAARIGADDLAEDEAAHAVASVLAGPGVRISRAATGRCNLHATGHGLLAFDATRIDRLNLIDPAITIATAMPFTPVDPEQMVATVKIIPFAASRRAVDAVRAAAETADARLRVTPFRAWLAGLVLTRLPGTKESVLDGRSDAMRARLAGLGSRLGHEIRCDHDIESVAAAIADLARRGCDILFVFGASAITDVRDVIPAAVVQNGGRIIHFGMPVDPGNLLLLARLGDTPVLGLPGCARSAKLNGVDFVLQRIVAGLDVTAADIMRMGVGGLLVDVPERPLPRAEAVPPEPTVRPDSAPRVTAVVLAAGRSSRMQGPNKLLAMVDGEPIIARVVRAALLSQVDDVVVVAGHDADRVRAALPADPKLTVVENPDYALGLSTSLRRGIAAVPASSDGAIICLGDMPRITARHIDTLIAAFVPASGHTICVPVHDGKRGNPVLFARRYFDEMRAASGDSGAKHLIGTHADHVHDVAFDDDAIFADLDTPADLAAFRARDA